jgi:hypothetical protein
MCFDEDIPENFASELLGLLEDNSDEKQAHGSESNCSVLTSTESGHSMDTKDSTCSNPSLQLTGFDTPQFLWCPKYLEQANMRLLDMLGIHVQVSTGCVPGLPVEKKFLVINHQLPEQRTYSRSMPPKDMLKVLLLDPCVGKSDDIVATV